MSFAGVITRLVIWTTHVRPHHQREGLGLASGVARDGGTADECGFAQQLRELVAPGAVRWSLELLHGRRIVGGDSEISERRRRHCVMFSLCVVLCGLCARA
jgi:hypothetical protein